jgi:hypothetical protein
MTQEEFGKALQEARELGRREGRAQASNGPLKALTFKVSLPHAEEKDGKGNVSRKESAGGAVSIYNLRRFPVTFYIEELERIWAVDAQLKAFCKTNANKLTRKRAVAEVKPDEVNVKSIAQSA